MSLFPADDKARKGLPIFLLVTRYFPKALREITKVSVANNIRYNPDRDPFDINWARGKSPDQLGSLLRHMMERAVDGKKFETISPDIAAKIGYDRMYVLAEAAWRALAALELEIEEVEAEQERGTANLQAFVDTRINPALVAFGEKLFSTADPLYPHCRSPKEDDEFWHTNVLSSNNRACGVPTCHVCGSNKGGDRG